MPEWFFEFERVEDDDYEQQEEDGAGQEPTGPGCVVTVGVGKHGVPSLTGTECQPGSR